MKGNPRYGAPPSGWGIRGANKPISHRCVTVLRLAGEKIGIFYGTSTGSTQDVAYRIAAEFGPEVAADPIDIEEIKERHCMG